MGLFSNNKKLCPICNNPTPRLFSTKIEDMPICKECDKKVDLPDGALDKMSLADFQNYIMLYDENQTWREIFTETYQYNFGFAGGSFAMDANNGLFRLKGYDNNSWVLQASQLKAFRILEDNKVLFESTADALYYYPSDVPERINAMAPQIAQFLIQLREYEMLERMERRQERNEREGDNPTPVHHHPRPHFDIPVPFRHFYVEVMVEHPYWNGNRWEISGPSISQYNPDIDSYLQEYDRKVNELHELAVNFMGLICPGAPEFCGEAVAISSMETARNMAVTAQAPSEDEVIEQLQKYKALLDAGILTEEEFTAKKRQLLGL